MLRKLLDTDYTTMSGPEIDVASALRSKMTGYGVPKGKSRSEFANSLLSSNQSKGLARKLGINL